MHLNNILITFYYENAQTVRCSHFCQFKQGLFLLKLHDKGGHNIFCLLENQHCSFMKQVFRIINLVENPFAPGKLCMTVYTISLRKTAVVKEKNKGNDCPYIVR